MENPALKRWAIVDLPPKIRFLVRVLTRAKKKKVRGDYKRSWMSDEYFDLIVWYKASNAIYGFQLCYDKANRERALTWLADRSFAHMEIDSGEPSGMFWGSSPILVPDGSFPAADVIREFRVRSEHLPKSLRNFVMAKLKQFLAKQKA